MTRPGVFLLTLGLCAGASAGTADVVDVAVRCTSQNNCTFAVTVRHDDEGWEHYADGFEILGADGEVIGTRVLRHPHVEEQPFTRALQDVKIPESVTEVRVRAHDSVHGHGGEEKTVDIPKQ